MTFARTETSVLNHLKFVGLDPGAIGLWALGNAYCWDQLTDGFIPKEQVPRLLSWIPQRKVLAWAEALVAATGKGRFKTGLWERVEGGYLVHDWLDHNPPAAKIIADREAAKERMRQRRGSRERTSERSTSRSTKRSGVRSQNVRDREVEVEVEVESPPTPLGGVRSNRSDTPTCSRCRGPAHPESVAYSIDGPMTGIPCYPSAEQRAAWVHLEDNCPRTEYLDRFPAEMRRQCTRHRGMAEREGR